MDYVTLDQITRDALLEMDMDAREYTKYLPLSVRAYRAIYTQVLNKKKTCFLTPNEARQAQLPDDYVYYTKVGICIKDCFGNRIIYTLTVNDKLCPPSECSSCKPTHHSTGSVSGNLALMFDGAVISPFQWRYYNAYRGGNYVGELFGQSGGHSEAGHFKIDEENNLIQLGDDVPPCEIILEYKSNGLTDGGNTKIPSKAAEACISFIKWKATSAKAQDRGIREENRLDYEDARELLNNIEEAFTPDELMDILYQSHYMTPK